jgi:hypothetical protein
MSEIEGVVEMKNGKRKFSDEMGTEGSKKMSKTSSELAEITPDMARASLEKCIAGVVPPRKGQTGYQPNAEGWAPAVYTKCGCILVQKKPSHQVCECIGSCYWIKLTLYIM